MHDPADMIGIVANAETRLDSFRETGCGPALGVETASFWTGVVKFGNGVKLFRRETTGPAGCAAFAQPIQSVPAQCAAPTGRSRSCDSELPSHLGLREPPLQVLCG